MQHGPPICWACKKFKGRASRTCEAFPEGIPKQIYFQGFDHRKAFSGDGGQRFESLPTESIPKAVLYWFRSRPGTPPQLPPAA